MTPALLFSDELDVAVGIAVVIDSSSMELCSIFFFVYAYVTWQLTFILELVKAEENETTIKQRLLKDYDRSMTPVLYAKSEQVSYIAMMVFRTLGLDEVKGEFILEGVTHIGWDDHRLTWENENVKIIRVSSGEIWMPHLKVLNRCRECCGRFHICDREDNAINSFSYFNPKSCKRFTFTYNVLDGGRQYYSYGCQLHLYISFGRESLHN
ncbi:unnamed protein product [Larinioides sclopetarius]|uniref:Neurotransmitter-gated ion-channel ligand-binding domain-containing protein n=1 Tax=Larinioides sclopetarius TaxID=280406 RepID=A0AAV2B6K8_9ARAC